MLYSCRRLLRAGDWTCAENLADEPGVGINQKKTSRCGTMTSNAFDQWSTCSSFPGSSSCIAVSNSARFWKKNIEKHSFETNICRITVFILCTLATPLDNDWQSQAIHGHPRLRMNNPQLNMGSEGPIPSSNFLQFIVDLPNQDGDFPVRKLLVYHRLSVLSGWSRNISHDPSRREPGQHVQRPLPTGTLFAGSDRSLERDATSDPRGISINQQP